VSVRIPPAQWGVAKSCTPPTERQAVHIHTLTHTHTHTQTHTHPHTHTHTQLTQPYTGTQTHTYTQQTYTQTETEREMLSGFQQTACVLCLFFTWVVDFPVPLWCLKNITNTFIWTKHTIS